MSTTTILPDVPALSDAQLHELVTLEVEVFANTYGADWETAYTLAAALLPDLLAYAATWDGDALLSGNDEVTL